MLKVTLRGIKAHFGRFLLTMLAVALGIAFLSGTLSLRQDIYVVGPKISSSSSPLTMRDQVPLDLQEKVQKVQGVSEVRPYYVSIAVLMKQDGTPLRTAGTATAQVVEPGPGGPKLVSGKAPAKNQVAIPHKDAKKLGVKIGDKVKFVVEGTPLDFTVSGFYKLPIDIQAYQIVYMNPEQARSLLGASGKSMYLSVSKNKGASTTAVVHNINKVLDRGTEAMTASKLADEDNKTIDQVLGFVNTFLLVFVLLALFVGTFIIGNTFQMSVKARTKEFALMRAVGVSSGQIFLSVALESVVIGLIGSIIGVALGAGLLAAMGALISAAGLPHRHRRLRSGCTIACSACGFHCAYRGNAHRRGRKRKAPHFAHYCWRHSYRRRFVPDLDGCHRQGHFQPARHHAGRWGSSPAVWNHRVAAYSC